MHKAVCFQLFDLDYLLFSADHENIFYASFCCLLIYLFFFKCEFLLVISDQLSGEHGPPLRRLGQGQACNHIQPVPLWAEGFPQLLLQGNPQCMETFQNIFLQSCPPWVFTFLHHYFTRRAGTDDTFKYYIFIHCFMMSTRNKQKETKSKTDRLTDFYLYLVCASIKYTE